MKTIADVQFEQSGDAFLLRVGDESATITKEQAFSLAEVIETVASADDSAAHIDNVFNNWEGA